MILAKDPMWVRRKMGHLLLHLNARQKWQTEVIGRELSKHARNPDYTIKGITDHGYPTNWGLTQEKNTVEFILGREYTGSWTEALEDIRKFVYKKQENTTCSLPNNKSLSPPSETAGSSSKPVQAPGKPTQ